MSKPILTVIAGCNGSGKSSFSSALSPLGTPSFDYDKEFLSIYNRLEDSELRELISHNKARALLEDKIQHALNQKLHFTYETNFNSTPLHWPLKFKEANFELRLFYFCLNSIEEAKRRVQIRVENGGHFVPEWEIEKRYFEGFENLNKHFELFDRVFLFETSAYKQEPQHILTVAHHKIQREVEIPMYLTSLIPSVLKN